MKYLYSTVLLILLYSACLSDKVLSANDNQLITELKVVDSDSTFRYLYLYDNSGNKVLETKYYQKDSIWIRKSQNEWIYNGANCTTQLERLWKNNAWSMTYSIDYDYNNQKLNSETHSTYNEGTVSLFKKTDYKYDLTELSSKKEYTRQSDSWVLTLVTDFRYLENGNTDSIITSNYKSGNLNSQMLSTFAYNPDGTIISQLFQEKAGDSWVNTEKINWFYMPNSTLPASVRNKKWMSDTFSWENTQRIDYQYDDAKNLISETYQRWKTMFWQNDVRYDYKFENSGKLLKKTLYMPIYSDWRSTISINYSNFTQDKANNIESDFEFWGGTTGQLTTSYIPFMFNNEQSIQKGKSIRISYVPVSETALYTPVQNSTYHLIPVYPNPSVGIFYINTQKYTLKSWIVTDMNGQVLKSQVQDYQSGVIDLTDLPKGIYILRATTTNEQMIQKLIKE